MDDPDGVDKYGGWWANKIMNATIGDNVDNLTAGLG